MITPLLALFARSLREDTRLKMTYVARVGIILIILFFLTMTLGETGWSNAPGLAFFTTVIVVNSLFILLAGLSHFSSAITEEKEELTLGLLRMTNLNPLSILLGKSTSRLAGALFLLAVQFPFTLLAISLGGVGARQIVAAYCTLGAAIIFLSNLALLASVICRRTFAAAGLTAAILGAIFLGLPLLHHLVQIPRRIGAISTPAPWVEMLARLDFAIDAASPINRLGVILQTGFDEGPMSWQVWSNLALGAGCFLLAWLVFERFSNEQADAAPRRWIFQLRTSQRRKSQRVWKHPLVWKDFYFVVGGKVGIGLKLMIYGLGPLIFFAVQTQVPAGGKMDLDTIGYILIFLTSIAVGVELAFIAANVFHSERKWKTLSSLIMLPMSTRSLAYRKIVGCLPTLLPAFIYMGMGAACIATDIDWRSEFQGFRFDLDIDDVAATAYSCAQGVFFLHLVANLSLRIRRGALPFAIAVMAVLHTLLGVSVYDHAREASFFVLAALTLLATGFLHYDIGRRLELVAAED